MQHDTGFDVLRVGTLALTMALCVGCDDDDSSPSDGGTGTTSGTTGQVTTMPAFTTASPGTSSGTSTTGATTGSSSGGDSGAGEGPGTAGEDDGGPPTPEVEHCLAMCEAMDLCSLGPGFEICADQCIDGFDMYAESCHPDVDALNVCVTALDCVQMTDFDGGGTNHGCTAQQQAIAAPGCTPA